MGGEGSGRHQDPVNKLMDARLPQPMSNLAPVYLPNLSAVKQGGAISTGNTATSGAALLRQVVLGTDATPPAAGLYPPGTIYLQYTP